MSEKDGNLKRWVLEAAGGEEIEAVVVGWSEWSDGGVDPGPLANKVAKWSEVEALLDFDFYSGYGGAQCNAINAIYAWTKSWVIAVSEYDGATGISKLPRNPMACEPSYH